MIIESWLEDMSWLTDHQQFRERFGEQNKTSQYVCCVFGLKGLQVCVPELFNVISVSNWPMRTLAPWLAFSVVSHELSSVLKSPRGKVLVGKQQRMFMAGVVKRGGRLVKTNCHGNDIDGV